MLGTVRTSATVATRIRFGQNLEKDFGPPRIRPAVSDGAPPVGDGFGWYVFLGGSGSAVARDIFLDGNTFVDSRRVVKVPLQAEWEGGIAFLYQGYRFSYTQVYRTREWVGQDRPSTYGVVAMNFQF